MPKARNSDIPRPAEPPTDVNKEFEAAQNALTALQAKLSQAPDDDWRASILWEGIERVLQSFCEAGFEYFHHYDDEPPAHYQHWKQKYLSKPLF